MSKKKRPHSIDIHGSWYTKESGQVLEHFKSRAEGLSEKEVHDRLKEFGPNAIDKEEGTPAWEIVLRQFKSPLIYVLLAAAAITISIQHWGDTIVIGIVLVLNAVIGFFQEYQAENAIAALMSIIKTKAKVRRGGEETTVDGAGLVPGDIVRLEEGDMIPADLRLIRVSSLKVNESTLTGESVPVEKSFDALADAGPKLTPADQVNMAFQGTAVTSGNADGVVIATGRYTQVGDIAQSMREAEEGSTPLQARMGRLGTRISIVVVSIAVLGFVIGVATGNNVQEMLLTAVAIAVSAIPEGLPIVMTVALAVAVRRMAKRHAMIRQLPAVETLGSTTVICTDKTGTLTQNQMTVVQVHAGGVAYEVTGTGLSSEGDIRRDGKTVSVEEGSPLYYTLLAGSLSSRAELGDSEAAKNGEAAARREEATGDPMEMGLIVSGEKAGIHHDALEKALPEIDEVPFSSDTRFSATVHSRSRLPNGTSGGEDAASEHTFAGAKADSTPIILVKGAPERILEMCDSRLGEGGATEPLDADAVSDQAEEMAAKGLRVLGMAIGSGADAAERIHADAPEGFTFVGMQGLLDPPRPEVIEAIAKCRRAGIRVCMVTGDHATTAAAIAAKLNLTEAAPDAPHGHPEARTGKQLEGLTDEQLDETIKNVSVYARVSPRQKLRLVQRFRAGGEIVAVTGDGVNDAPALKAAHIGTAMGQAGTEVSKEASDMILTDDNFTSIYAAVEEGRTVFHNIRMATFFLLSSAAGELLSIIVSLMARFPLPLLPAQILWVNVVTNGIQDVALAFEEGDKSLVECPPRSPKEGVLNKVLYERMAIIGVLFAAGTLAIFWWENHATGDMVYARTAALTMLVLFQVYHVFNCRSEHRSVFSKSLFSNKILFWGTLASLVIHIAALYIPVMQTLLQVKPLALDTWLLIVVVGLSAFVANELHKRFRG